MKYILAFSMLVTATGAIYGQPAVSQSNQCALNLAQAPAVRGIKLGMKLEQVLALFPVSEQHDYVKNLIANRASFPSYGVISFVGVPTSRNKDQFPNIRSLDFVFVDDNLVRYEIGYEWPPWPKLEDFVDKVAAAFHLPPANNWASDGSVRKNLACDGFRLQAMTRDGNATLTVRTAAEPSEIQRERRAAAEAQARRDFRP